MLHGKFDIGPDGEYVRAKPAEEGVSEHWIPDSNLEKLLEKLAKLSAKAASLGAPPIVVNVTDEKKVEKKDKDSASGIVYTKVIVSGTAPRFSGYSFLAKVQHTKSGNLLFVTPGMTVPEKFRYTDSHCDHCNTKRSRNLTYIVKHEGDDKVLQVGSNCLADFLGHRSPEQIAWMAQFLTELDDTVNGFRSGGEELVDLDRVLVMSACVMRNHGWTSSKLAMEMARRKEDGEFVTVPRSTASRVTTQLWPPTSPRSAREEFERNERLHPEKQDEELAATAKRWAADVEPNGEYLHNLKVIAHEKYLKPKAFGLAVSLVMAYKRSLESDAEREAKKKVWQAEKEKKVSASQYVGAVGERRDFKLFVEKVFPKETDFGMTYITKMVDEAGNVFTWFATGTILEEQKWYEMKATIKGHDDKYQGIKQTTITRAKIKEAPIDEKDPNAVDHDQWGYRVKFTKKYGEVRLENSSGQYIKDKLDGEKWVFLEFVTPPKSENPPSLDELAAEEDLVDLRQV